MSPRPIFGIFEGGGAKGIAHLGAFSACEQNGFYFVGVAGASAGAIVATLIASGFSANALLDPAVPETNILARYGETPLSLIGEAAWRAGRSYVEHAKRAVAPKGVKGRWRSRRWLLLNRKPVVKALERTGYLSTAHAREVLNRILRDQLAAVRDKNGLAGLLPDRIAFRDLNTRLLPETRPLKIIAANIDNQELVIFDQERTPDTEVALAVAASIAIPGLFEPVVIPDASGAGRRFMDGGAVSNLPVWVFANDKLAFERANPELGPVPTVGFTLQMKGEPEPASGAMPAWASYIGSGLATTLAGSQSVIEEFIEDLRVIPLHTTLGPFSFDAPLADMIVAHQDGARCADRDLKYYLIDRPRLVRAELADFHEAVRLALIHRLPAEHRRRPILLRAAIIERLKGDVFQVTHAINMDDDADDRLTLDSRGRASPSAYREREAQFLRVWEAVTEPQPTKDYMTKYERALANKKVRAIVAAPIFENVSAWFETEPLKRPRPCGVVAVDADRDDELEAAFNDPKFMDLVRTQSTLLYPALMTEPPRG